MFALYGARVGAAHSLAAMCLPGNPVKGSPPACRNTVPALGKYMLVFLKKQLLEAFSRSGFRGYPIFPYVCNIGEYTLSLN